MNRVRRGLVLGLFAYIIGTYWTLEVWYTWKMGSGIDYFDVWYSYIAYSGIAAAGALAFLALRPRQGP